MFERCALIGLLAAFLGLGFAWQSELEASPESRESALRRRQIGSRRALDAMMRLGVLQATTDDRVLDPVGDRSRAAGILTYGRYHDVDGPGAEFASTALARAALGDDLTFDVVSLAIDPRDLNDPDFGLFSRPTERGKKWHRGAGLSMFVDGRVTAESTVGVSVHGDSSRRMRRKSLRLLLTPTFGPSIDVADLQERANGRGGPRPRGRGGGRVRALG